MFLFFPILQVIFVSLIIQMKIIFNKDYRKRYNEIYFQDSFSKTFYISLLFDFFIFLIFLYLFWFIFYISLKDFLIFYKFLFLIISLILVIFDVIYFNLIESKDLKELKLIYSLSATPTIPVFYKKGINIIANPMSNRYYWFVLILLVLVKFLSLKFGFCL